MDLYSVECQLSQSLIFLPEEKVSRASIVEEPAPQASPQPDKWLDEFSNYVRINEALDQIEALPSMQNEKIKRAYIRPVIKLTTLSDGEMMTMCTKPGDLPTIADMLGKYIAGIRLESNHSALDEKISTLEWIWAYMHPEHKNGLLKDSDFMSVFKKYSDGYQTTIATAFPLVEREQAFISQALAAITPQTACIRIYQAFTHLEAIQSLPLCDRMNIDLKKTEALISLASDLHMVFDAEENWVHIRLTCISPPLETMDVRVLANVLSKLIVRSLCDSHLRFREKCGEEFRAIWEEVIKKPQLAATLATMPQLTQLHVSRHARTAYVPKVTNSSNSNSLRHYRECLGSDVSFRYDACEIVSGELKRVLSPELKGTIVVQCEGGEQRVYRTSMITEFSRRPIEERLNALLFTESLETQDADSSTDDDEACEDNLDAQDTLKLVTLANRHMNLFRSALQLRQLHDAHVYLQFAMKRWGELVERGELNPALTVAVRDSSAAYTAAMHEMRYPTEKAVPLPQVMV